MKKNLLDYIYENIEINYLSDLKIKVLMKKNIDFIKAINQDDFSFNDWKDTCDYIFKYKNFTSSKNAKYLLIRWIEE